MNFSRKYLLLPLLLTALAITFDATAQTQNKITLQKLEAMFSDMRLKTKWNIDGPLLWGYFFVNSNEDKLKQAATELVASEYKLVRLEAIKGKHLFLLHVERVETHTPSSLNARNNEFYKLAEKYSLDSYDGMDVGPAPPVTSK
jgi:hypothetical protein